MSNILNFFKEKSTRFLTSDYDRAKAMCQRMEIEVIKAVVMNFCPGQKFTLDVLEQSDELCRLCDEMGAFCAKRVPHKDMQQFVLPKPTYINDMEKYFKVDANQDLKIYCLVVEPMFKAACFKVYMEYLRLINESDAHVELAKQNINVCLTEAVDLCNEKSLEYKYPQYASAIAGRKACVVLNIFLGSLRNSESQVSRIDYNQTRMYETEKELTKAIRAQGYH